MSARQPAVYGKFNGGLDPLAPLVDVGDGVDQLGKKILEGKSVKDALRDLMRSGASGRKGLEQIFREIRQRHKKVRESAAMNGLLEDLAKMLAEAKELEQAALFADPSDNARFAESLLDALPEDIPRAMRELDNYQWRSPIAENLFADMKERLRSDVIDQQFAGLSKSLQDMGTAENQKLLAQMMADLNTLLQDHRTGTATQEEYESFIEKYQSLFPDAPETLEQFIDDLARQSAAMDRMLASMSDEQRAHLSQAMEQALADLGITDQMAQMQEHLQALRPEFARQAGPSLTGERSQGLSQATNALAELGDLEELLSQIQESYEKGDPSQIDLDLLEKSLGRSSRDEIEAMSELQQDLLDQGFLVEGNDSLRLSAKAVRRIGESALREVFKNLDGGLVGDHQMPAVGKSGEMVGTHRSWSFGDDGTIDLVRTVQNASRRRMTTGSAANLSPEDFEIAETESLIKAAVVLLVDQSYSMYMNQTWGAAKTMALALSSLSASKYPLDALQIIGFSDLARVVEPLEIPDLEANQSPGTNLQHALILAADFFDRHPGSHRIVMVVTDGEPTAHLLASGQPWFNWPPDFETIEETIRAVDNLTRRKVVITWFRLGNDPALAKFLEEMAQRNGGKVLATDPDRLGEYVISDYVKRKS